MKKTLILVVVMLFVATSAFAGIVGSKHDLRAAPYIGATMSACQYCHTPHNPVAAAAPLWNKTLPAGPYTMYVLTNPGGNIGAAPGSASLTCLTCHDGTLNIGDVVTGTSDVITDAGGVLDANGLLTSGANLTTDLRTTHPIGVVYDTGRAYLTAIDGAAAPNGVDQYVRDGKKWKIYGGSEDVGTVECASCHNPHNTTAGQTPFLKDTKNTMCTDCHGE